MTFLDISPLKSSMESAYTLLDNFYKIQEPEYDSSNSLNS